MSTGETSMLDEAEDPTKEKRFFICPCCVLSFVRQPQFVLHCEAMKTRIDAAIESSKIERKKK